MPGRFRVKIEEDDGERKRRKSADEEFQQTAEEIAELVSEETGAEKCLSETDAAQLRSEIESARRAVEEEHNRYMRALADFVNYKRRRQEECEAQGQFASQELILKLLPVIDNFERALQAAQENENFQALADGVSLTLRQLRDLLEKEGVTPIEAVGQEFDPNVHEAVMRVESDDYPDNTVVEELERGYMQRSRVLRPSKVKVATR
ncbi:MAG: nucleotide exchange factor GrpE [Armatimonadota bacterium]|nr:nucleotide exchange factor GrpE [Armatimonadota bacterium]